MKRTDDGRASSIEDAAEPGRKTDALPRREGAGNRRLPEGPHLNGSEAPFKYGVLIVRNLSPDSSAK